MGASAQEHVLSTIYENMMAYLSCSRARVLQMVALNDDTHGLTRGGHNIIGLIVKRAKQEAESVKYGRDKTPHRNNIHNVEQHRLSIEFVIHYGAWSFVRQALKLRVAA